MDTLVNLFSSLFKQNSTPSEPTVQKRELYVYIDLLVFSVFKNETGLGVKEFLEKVGTPQIVTKDKLSKFEIESGQWVPLEPGWNIRYSFSY